MQKNKIAPPTLPNLGFPWAVRVTDFKELVVISGIAPMDASGKIADSDVAGQFVCEMNHIKELLAEADMTIENLVSLTVTLTEAANIHRNWDAFLKAYLEYFPADEGPAAGTLRVVRNLSHPKMLVEVEGIAAK